MNRRDFATALLNGRSPAGLTTWNASDPAHRFAIYRNNVVVSLIDALAANYPVTRELVGEEFFAAMARDFIVAHPPRSPILAVYGVDTPNFAASIADFPPAQSVPYLSDMARLEAARIVVYHAADDMPLVLRSRYAIASLWLAHQDRERLTTTDPFRTENALLVRRGDDVLIAAIEDADADRIASLLTIAPSSKATGALP